MSSTDHRALLQAVKERDTPHAVTLLEQHLNRGVEVITRYLASSAGQSRKAAR